MGDGIETCHGKTRALHKALKLEYDCGVNALDSEPY